MDFLVRKAKKHDKEAFQSLMLQYGPDLYKVAKAILKNDDDVSDAMQETALTCWEKIGTLKKDRYFKTWLTRILINHCNAICRQRRKAISQDEVREAWYQENEFLSLEWREFLECLDEKYRAIVLLYYVQGFTTREIAAILDTNESTVRSRMQTARGKLRKEFSYE